MQKVLSGSLTFLDYCSDTPDINCSLVGTGNYALMETYLYIPYGIHTQSFLIDAHKILHSGQLNKMHI